MSDEDNIFDAQGYRFNVGIILLNNNLDKAFWGKRLGHDSWQFPQGGLNAGESALEAAFRELKEETGLENNDVALIGATKTWFKYRLPFRFRRPRKQGFIQCIGQKQRWFLMKLLTTEKNINLVNNGEQEFDSWQWINYWDACDKVVHFKRKVYYQALQELNNQYPTIIRRKNEI